METGGYVMLLALDLLILHGAIVKRLPSLRNKRKTAGPINVEAASTGGDITAGDYVVTVNGMSVANTAQFKSLVSKTPRPIVLRFRRKCNAAYDLFGERAREDGGNDLFG
uniref:PDZ domain-containing protein n=1 Tax=Peronospora matthiolae TaxID=2874970 RepID=A0AAV1UWV7_9STRA